MVHHLKTDHNITDQTKSKQNSLSLNKEPPSKRQKTLLECFKKSSLEEEISKLLAESNLTFNQVSESRFIRESLAGKYRNNNIPKGHDAIAALMMKYYDFAFGETKEAVKKMKEKTPKANPRCCDALKQSGARWKTVFGNTSISSKGFKSQRYPCRYHMA